MKLYHITSKANKEQILKEGFSLRKNKNYQISGNGVYLTEKNYITYWEDVVQQLINDYNTEILEVSIAKDTNIFEMNQSTREKCKNTIKFENWLQRNLEQNLEITKHIEDSNEKLGFLLQKYVTIMGYDGIRFNKFYRDINKNKIIISSETVIYNLDKIISVH